MRARTYGLLVLAAVGIIPLGTFGLLTISRAERTAVAEVREGNRRLAGQVAEQIAAYLRAERDRLAVIGAAALQAHDGAEAQRMLDAYGLDYQHLHDLVVHRRGGDRFAGPTIAQFLPLVAAALAGNPARSRVRPARGDRGGGFAHTLMLAEPVIVAGRQEGAIAAQVDLIGLWPPINAIRIGRTGFARLLTLGGELLAHGNPDERRFVFSTAPPDGQALIARALLSPVIENQQGRKVVASLALVPGSDWLVVVEQEVAEAYHPAATMKRDLAILGGAAMVVVVVLGILFGQSMVRGFERLRAHTRVLAAGDLEARAPADSPLLEVRELAGALDEMAASLARLEAEARARERMSVFARTAAGLAHDLRLPLQTVRSAVDAIIDSPDDAEAWELLTRVNQRDLPRLNDYLRDLHRLARRGDIEAEFLRTDPAALAADVVEELESARRWGEVDFAVVGAAPPIDVDPKLMRRAMLNLAANAAEACLRTRDGMVRFEIGDRDHSLEIRVVDNGIGIPLERLAGLLSADFQSTSRTIGVGLGVGVARQIVESHGGRLRVTSEVDVGTTFVIELPRGDQTAGGVNPGSER